MIQILRLNDYKKMPWKNGQGITFEIAREDIINTEDYLWRVSMADVTHEGEFSIFPNKHRLISVLSGEGIELTINQQQRISLFQREVFQFDGTWHVDCKLKKNAIRDLNLIYEKGGISPRFQWIKSTSPELFISAADEILIFNMQPNLVIEVQKKFFELSSLDCLKISKMQELIEVKLLKNTAKDYCVIEIFKTKI